MFRNVMVRVIGPGEEQVGRWERWVDRSGRAPPQSEVALMVVFFLYIQGPYVL